MRVLYHINRFCQERSFLEIKSLRSSLPIAEKRTLDYLLFHFRRKPDKPLFQQEIANKLKYHRTRINEAISYLSKIGLIGKITRLKKACTYFFDPYLLEPAKYQIKVIHDLYQNPLPVDATTHSSSSILTYIRERDSKKWYRGILAQTIMLRQLTC